MTTHKATIEEVVPGGPSIEREISLRIKSPSRPATAPAFSSQLIFAATGLEHLLALTYVCANARIYTGAKAEIVTATADHPGAVSPIAGLISSVKELGQGPEADEIASRYGHFDATLDILKNGGRVVFGAAPSAARLFCRCVLATLPPDKGDVAAVHAIVAADATTASLRAAVSLLAEVDSISTRVPFSARHLVIVSSGLDAFVDPAEFEKIHQAASKGAFKICTIPRPSELASATDGAVATLSLPAATESRALPSDYSRRSMGWARWVRETTQRLMDAGAIPQFELPSIDLDLIKAK